jgi:hypothetical protein
LSLLAATPSKFIGSVRRVRWSFYSISFAGEFPSPSPTSRTWLCTLLSLFVASPLFRRPRWRRRRFRRITRDSGLVISYSFFSRPCESHDAFFSVHSQPMVFERRGPTQFLCSPKDYAAHDYVHSIRLACGHDPRQDIRRNPHLQAGHLPLSGALQTPGDTRFPEPQCGRTKQFQWSIYLGIGERCCLHLLNDTV